MPISILITTTISEQSDRLAAVTDWDLAPASGPGPRKKKRGGVIIGTALPPLSQRDTKTVDIVL